MVHAVQPRIHTLLRLRDRGHGRRQPEHEQGQKGHDHQQLHQREALLPARRWSAPSHRVTSPCCKGRCGRRVSKTQLRFSTEIVMRKACRGTAVSGRPPTEKGAEATRSEEHTSELQSQSNLVCRLLLEKKKNKKHSNCTRRHNHIQQS